jgi:hypothetical protein
MSIQLLAQTDCGAAQFVEHRRLLLSLVFTPDEASACLAEEIGLEQVEDLRVARVYSRLAAMNGMARQRIEEKLFARLGRAASQFSTLRLCGLAALWSRRREVMEPRTVAALLWVVLGSDCVQVRRLAHSIAAELTIRAVRTFARGDKELSSPSQVASAF